MPSTVASIETFIISIPREIPYLGPLGNTESANAHGYFIREGNRAIYPTSDISVLVRCETECGLVGWGECYGICAPEAVTAIINDLLAPCVVGQDPFDVQVVHDRLYDLMRLRGFGSGYYMDALAGIDIALWDLCGKLCGKPLFKLLGGAHRYDIPAYVSGLPSETVNERVALAVEFEKVGFSAVKFAAAVSQDQIVDEALALRKALKPTTKLMVDMHWKYTAQEAIAILSNLNDAQLYFAEAPCKPEDITGLAQVSRHSRVPIAAGEEWHTEYEVLPRLEMRACTFVQPEMAHTGITQFMRIARLARTFHCKIIPHASIGIGIFQAASLHAAMATPDLLYHEYQHSIFDRNLEYIDGDMSCSDGVFRISDGPGIGVVPKEDVFEFVRD